MRGQIDEKYLPSILEYISGNFDEVSNNKHFKAWFNENKLYNE